MVEQQNNNAIRPLQYNQQTNMYYQQQPLQGQNSGLLFHPRQAQQYAQQQTRMEEKTTKTINKKLIMIMGIIILIIALALTIFLIMGKENVTTKENMTGEKENVITQQPIIETTTQNIPLKQQEVTPAQTTDQKYSEVAKNKQTFSLNEIEFCKDEGNGNYVATSDKFSPGNTIMVCAQAQGFTDTFNNEDKLRIVIQQEASTYDSSDKLLKTDKTKIDTTTENPNYAIPINYAVQAGQQQPKGEYKIVLKIIDGFTKEQSTQEIRFEII